MDEEIREAFRDIKSTIEIKSSDTVRSIGQVHEKVNREAQEVKDRLAHHSEESARRYATLKSDTVRNEKDIAEEVRNRRSEKNRSWQMWVAIMGGIGAAIVALLKDCGSV